MLLEAGPLSNRRGASYAAAVLADSPAAFWKLADASGNFTDSSGNSNTLTKSGTISYHQTGPSTIPGSFAIKPTSSGVGAGSQFSAAVDNLTMEAWINFPNWTAQPVICDNRNVAGNNGYDMLVVSGGQVSVNLKGIGIFSGTAALSTSTWYLIAIQRVSGTWKSYINGALDNGSITSSAPTAPSGATTGFSGCDNGTLAYIAFYTTALSAARLAAHYAATAP